MKITDLEKARNERQAPCPFCGKDPHKGEYECPRIRAIRQSPEGDIIIYFHFGIANVPSD